MKRKQSLSELKVGQIFKTDIGEFVVAEQADTETKVITNGPLESEVKFSSLWSNQDYKISDIRKHCDTEIEQKFARVFGECNLLEKEVSLITIDGKHDFGSVACKVHPPTFDEIREFSDLIDYMYQRGDIEETIWTCTPWSTSQRYRSNEVAVMLPEGVIEIGSTNDDYGLMLIASLKSGIYAEIEEWNQREREKS